MDWTQISALCAISVVAGGGLTRILQIGAKNQEIKQITNKLAEFSMVLSRIESKVDDMAQRVSKLEGVVEILTGWKNNQPTGGN